MQINMQHPCTLNDGWHNACHFCYIRACNTCLCSVRDGQIPAIFNIFQVVQTISTILCSLNQWDSNYLTKSLGWLNILPSKYTMSRIKGQWSECTCSSSITPARRNLFSHSTLHTEWSCFSLISPLHRVKGLPIYALSSESHFPSNYKSPATLHLVLHRLPPSFTWE